MCKLKTLLDTVKKKIINEDYRFRLQTIAVFIILAVISGGMTILNVFTERNALMYSTLIFSVICVIDVFVFMRSKLSKNLSLFIFAVQIYILFSFFIFSGKPEGFSALWICLVPSFGLLLFGRKNGTVLCAGMFAILVFSFYTPIGRSLLQYNYTKTFENRFPILYLAFFCVAFLLETVRAYTHKALVDAENRYKELYSLDALTKVFNRYGFNEHMKHELEIGGKIHFLMVDVDNFKNVNDTFGHVAGDKVLVEIAELISNKVSGVDTVCRWGGEEFAILIKNVLNDNTLKEFCEELRKHIEKTPILYEGKEISVTVCIGVVTVNDCTGFTPSQIVNEADENMYFAKQHGKNQNRYSIL